MSTVTVTHRYAHPAHQVFDAWLNPAKARRFLFATPTGTMVRAEIDARVGGRFLFTDRRPPMEGFDGGDIDHVGEYLEIDPPRRLVFRFTVPKYTQVETTVTIEIVPEPRGCQLTLTHEGIDADFAHRTEHGWGMILTELEGVLAASLL